MIDPYTARVRVSQGEALGDVMNKLRSWLDGQKIQPTEFKTAADAAGCTFYIGFKSVEEATWFRDQFGIAAHTGRARTADN
jgi:hypothetical protein